MNSFKERPISITHPVLMAGAFSLGLPVFLGLASLGARSADHGELARSLWRSFGYVLTAETLAIFLLCVVGWRYEHRARARDASVRPPGQLIDLGGYRLHLNCSGQGSSTVILEHGAQSTYLDWYLVQPEIAKFTRVCSYDRAGLGWSDASPKPRLPSVMTEELHALLHTAGEKPPYILIGHSFGALDALMFAHKFPAETAGIVLVDGSSPAVLSRITFRDKLWLGGMQIALPFGLPRWRGWCGSRPEAVREIKAAITCRPRFFRAIYREWSAFPAASAEMEKIRSIGNIPLVVIARDPAAGTNPTAEARHYELQRRMLDLSSNSRFLVAGGSRHDVPRARPDVIVEAVKLLITPPALVDKRESR